MTPSSLETAAVGQPITRLGVSLFPVYLPGNRIPRIAAGKDSGLVVEELDSPSVPHLKAENPTDTPVLVLEGEHFLGGWQNRTANATVLVPPRSTLEIPVTCLEAGRWGGPGRGENRPPRMSPETAMAPNAVRHSIRASVSMSLQQRRGHQVDQGAAWDAVSAELARHGAESRTAAAHEAERVNFRRHRSRRLAADALVAHGPLPRQSGICVTHGGLVKAVEIFGSNALLRAYWRGLVRAHLADPPKGDAGGGPEGPHGAWNRMAPSAERALWAVRRMARMRVSTTPGVGLGVEARARDGMLAAVALMVSDGLVHQSALFTA